MSSSISTVEAKLPPGFRFHPTDDELICDYLMKKLADDHSFQLSSPILIDVDLNKCEPWDLPETACVGGKEWYFYSQRDRKYATGLRTNRATVSGYWKATGKDRAVSRKGSLVGMRKTLVFYQGRAPKGRKSEWVMHEFRLEGPFGPPKLSTFKEDWVLCRVFHKSRELEPSKHALTLKTSNPSYDKSANSPSLPSLMDSFITFDQTPQPPAAGDLNNSGNVQNDNTTSTLAYRQVPCFSMFHQTNSPPNFPLTHPTFAGAAVTPPSACDRQVINAVLSQLTDKSSPPVSLGEATGSSEGYLSEVGLSSMWTNHY